ncbi:hypothetical protein TNCT_99611 [Trichonephila clavata]|uniref:Uncharacterized protein n=1 Tax=Trichonephila clavata TaxID=2740835 RepID=A0A8X6HRW4_TRICU|nr:hypothetical protein TNCT_99611 [Trichonephila clavata]
MYIICSNGLENTFFPNISQKSLKSKVLFSPEEAMRGRLHPQVETSKRLVQNDCLEGKFLFRLVIQRMVTDWNLLTSVKSALKS